MSPGIPTLRIIVRQLQYSPLPVSMAISRHQIGASRSRLSRGATSMLHTLDHLPALYSLSDWYKISVRSLLDV